MIHIHSSIIHIPMPERMRALPLTETGFPVLFFARTVDGKPDLRVMDAAKWSLCVKRRLCWLCGQPLGRYLAWVLGGRRVVKKESQEPPNHRKCAEYAMRACPFLTRPHMHRRSAGLPEEASFMGIGIDRNPGVSVLWVARKYTVFKAHAGGGGHLIRLGAPNEVVWYAEGRLASVAEIHRSLDSGLPLLRAMAAKEGADSMADLERQIKAAMLLVPRRAEAVA